jgi:hypothetical protein
VKWLFSGIAGAVIVSLVFWLLGPYSPGDDRTTATQGAATTFRAVEMTTATAANTTGASSTSTETLPGTTNVRHAPGTVLYEADWSSGANGWTLEDGWKTVGGMLVTDGSVLHATFAIAPYDLGPVLNYAVEAEIQALDENMNFAVVARFADGHGYLAGYWGWYPRAVGPDGSYLQIWATGGGGDVTPTRECDVDTNWHLCRLEVVDNRLRFLLDGELVAEGTDNQNLEPGTAGLECGGDTQINVRSFKVTAL